jgi:SAM-dependent methyltransferase
MEQGLELTSQAEATHFWFHGFRRFVAPALKQAAAGRRDLRLVDCGCGTGHNLALLTPYGRAFGFDYTFGGVARAAASGHPVAHADITRIPLRTGSVDIATAFDVLQCVPDDATAVREMARILRPGGAVVLTVAAFDFLRGDHAIYWSECRRYTKTRARRLVEAAGLEPERISFLFASIFPMFAAARLLQRATRHLRTGVRADIDIRVPAEPINAALTRLLHAEACLAERVPMPIGSSILVVARKR